MVSETLRKSHLVDGEAEANLQKQGDQLASQILNGRCRKSGSDRNSIRPFLDDNCGEESEDKTGVAFYRDVPSSVNIDMQPDTLRVSKNMVSLVTANYSCHATFLFL